ncbi:cyclic pyranopterin monophosphate synthase [Desulfosporosinus acididurans]|uniref:Cyclic pyranopterin monophosphate synthase n=1 Tax=Desulfosporosinus acididurans TaxID=476652 RepID=A0A0J1FQH0_9FIRM|nr:radical SAM protein [Desulfosporosinus acididurans]KLU65739.1 cyclic pyranopterin monophosphate synthase [Desulfosporosinus acididurans]
MAFDTFTIILSNYCNLRCPFCLQAASVADDEVSAVDLIKFLSKYPLRTLKLTGGETLSGPVFPKTKLLYDYGISRGASIQVNTNGTFAFNDNPDKDLLMFQVSLDGLKTKHDSIRGKGVFDKAIKFIKTQQKRGYKLKIMNVITPETTTGELGEFVDYCLSTLNIRPHFQFAAPVGRAVGLRHAFDLERINSTVEFLIDKGCDETTRRIAFVGDCSIPQGRSSNLGIDHHGNLISCPILQDYKIGTIYEDLSDSKIRQRFARSKVSRCTCTFPQ